MQIFQILPTLEEEMFDNNSPYSIVGWQKFYGIIFHSLLMQITPQEGIDADCHILIKIHFTGRVIMDLRKHKFNDW